MAEVGDGVGHKLGGAFGAQFCGFFVLGGEQCVCCSEFCAACDVSLYGEGEEVKRSSGKGDGKHRDSASGRGREGAAEKEKEKERKFKEGGRSEESVDEQEQRVSKQVFEINGKLT